MSLLVVELRRAIKHREIAPTCECEICRAVRDMVDDPKNFAKEIVLKEATR